MRALMLLALAALAGCEATFPTIYFTDDMASVSDLAAADLASPVAAQLPLLLPSPPDLARAPYSLAPGEICDSVYQCRPPANEPAGASNCEPDCDGRCYWQCDVVTFQGLVTRHWRDTGAGWACQYAYYTFDHSPARCE